VRDRHVHPIERGLHDARVAELDRVEIALVEATAIDLGPVERRHREPRAGEAHGPHAHPPQILASEDLPREIAIGHDEPLPIGAPRQPGRVLRYFRGCHSHTGPIIAWSRAGRAESAGLLVDAGHAVAHAVDAELAAHPDVDHHIADRHARAHPAGRRAVGQRVRALPQVAAPYLRLPTRTRVVSFSTTSGISSAPSARGRGPGHGSGMLAPAARG
jgi:hypothetical protein